MKSNHIFDYLLKDKQIQLLDGHKIPPTEKIKGMMYCKWYDFYNHVTTNYIVFQKDVQKGIKKGSFKLADKRIE